MDREVLVTRCLSEDMIAAGEKLIERIKNDIDLKAVYWLYVSDIEEWRLVLVSEDLKKYGAKKLYEYVLKANEYAGEQENILPILNISVSSGLGKLNKRIKTISPKKVIYDNDLYIYSKDCVQTHGNSIYNQT